MDRPFADFRVIFVSILWSRWVARGGLSALACSSPRAATHKSPASSDMKLSPSCESIQDPIALVQRMLDDDMSVPDVVQALKNQLTVDARLVLNLFLRQQEIPLLMMMPIASWIGIIEHALSIVRVSMVSGPDKSARPLTWQGDLSTFGVIDARCASCIEALLDLMNDHASKNPELWLSGLRRHLRCRGGLLRSFCDLEIPTSFWSSGRECPCPLRPVNPVQGFVDDMSQFLSCGTHSAVGMLAPIIWDAWMYPVVLRQVAMNFYAPTREEMLAADALISMHRGKSGDHFPRPFGYRIRLHKNDIQVKTLVKPGALAIESPWMGAAVPSNPRMLEAYRAEKAQASAFSPSPGSLLAGPCSTAGAASSSVASVVPHAVKKARVNFGCRPVVRSPCGKPPVHMSVRDRPPTPYDGEPVD